MKRKLTLAAMTLLLAIGLSSAAAYADTVSLTLNNPVQYAAQTGTTLFFDATISAAAGNSGDVFLNGDGFNVSSPLTLDDIDFFLNFPASLTPGQSVTDVLFSVSLPADLAIQPYLGSFTLLGGSGAGSSDVLSSANFQVNVVPEPSTFLLLGTGLAGLIGTIRRKRNAWAS